MKQCHPGEHTITFVLLESLPTTPHHIYIVKFIKHLSVCLYRGPQISKPVKNDIPSFTCSLHDKLDVTCLDKEFLYGITHLKI